jgi:hypothetical protein
LRLPPRSLLDNHLLKPRYHRPAELGVAQRQLELLADGLIHLTADVQKAGANVKHFQKATAGADNNLVGTRHRLRADGPRSLARDDAPGYRQTVATDPVHGIRRKIHIRIDPVGFLEALGEGFGRQLTPTHIDGRIPSHSPDFVSLSLQFDQPPLARRDNVRGEGDEDDATVGTSLARSGTRRGENHISYSLRSI